MAKMFSVSIIHNVHAFETVSGGLQRRLDFLDSQKSTEHLISCSVRQILALHVGQLTVMHR